MYFDDVFKVLTCTSGEILENKNLKIIYVQVPQI